ncbi:hypothetical protein [Azotobacter beijerinckii]|uniref:hypothetical protein n=1 Tax=Azotobacter beijerinckii TaxID=170623 RepID=UPI0029548128|nr:hypothetical protein [Azotobacter beijerinckii]MDV7211321.1 hypothetical protein [Azotobacter beijerinckii]
MKPLPGRGSGFFHSAAACRRIAWPVMAAPSIVIFLPSIWAKRLDARVSGRAETFRALASHLQAVSSLLIT